MADQADSAPLSADTESAAFRSLADAFRSGRPICYVCSPEERRVASLVGQMAEQHEGAAPPIFSWSLTQGMRDAAGTALAGEDAAPLAALNFIADHPGPAFFHLKDFHEPMQQAPEVRRRLRELYAECFGTGKYVVISSPIRFVPVELEREIAYLDLPLPDPRELLAFLRKEAGAALGESDAELPYDLARALQGLTLDEARHALKRALATGEALDRGSVEALLEEKRLLLNRTGLVESVPAVTGIDQIGGLENLKTWLKQRRTLFRQREELSREIVPKGLMVMGISGCGKSLSVKAIASCFELPLYRIDMTSVFSGRNGPADQAFVDACRMLEQLAPAVVWFDEIENCIATDVRGAGGEAGRILGFFLTWMQEKPSGIFVAATANRIDLLPAEMIRKGRFDEVFFVDLPAVEERVQIFAIHLKRRDIDPEDFDLERVARFSETWTGAEIEQCVVSALTAALLEDRSVTDQDLITATVNVVPLAQTMKEQMDQIRAWAFDRAVRARPEDLIG